MEPNWFDRFLRLLFGHCYFGTEIMHPSIAAHTHTFHLQLVHTGQVRLVSFFSGTFVFGTFVFFRSLFFVSISYGIVHLPAGNGFSNCPCSNQEQDGYAIFFLIVIVTFDVRILRNMESFYGEITFKWRTNGARTKEIPSNNSSDRWN